MFYKVRPDIEANAAIGARVKVDGKVWHCVGHNDLNILYWNRTGNRGARARFYVGSDMDDAAGYPRRK